MRQTQARSHRKILGEGGGDHDTRGGSGPQTLIIYLDVHVYVYVFERLYAYDAHSYSPQSEGASVAVLADVDRGLGRLRRQFRCPDGL